MPKRKAPYEVRGSERDGWYFVLFGSDGKILVTSEERLGNASRAERLAVAAIDMAMRQPPRHPFKSNTIQVVEPGA